MLIYLPTSLSAAEDLPRLQDLLVVKNPLVRREERLVDFYIKVYMNPPGQKRLYWITNFYEQDGWLSVESSLRLSEEYPYRSGGKTPQPIPEALERKARVYSGKLVGQTANTYILGSIFSELVVGKLFDEEHFSSLLFGSAAHELENEVDTYNIPYADSEKIWSWVGCIDYSLARTVELRRLLPSDQIVLPEQRFQAYKEVYP